MFVSSHRKMTMRTVSLAEIASGPGGPVSHSANGVLYRSSGPVHGGGLAHDPAGLVPRPVNDDAYSKRCVHRP